MSDAPSPGSRSRRVIGAVAVGALLAAAVVTYQLAPGLPRTTAVGATPSTATAPSAPPSSSGPSTVSSPTPPASGSPSPSSTPVPSGPPGPGTTEIGILITATPTTDDHFAVVEQVRLAVPVETLSLRPPSLDRLGADFSDQTAEASGVEVTAGDQPQTVPDGSVTAPVELTLTTPASVFVLRYELEGTIVRTVPSTSGRALGAIGPLTAGVADDLPVIVYATGPAVINLACPTRTLAEQACASGEAPRLRTQGTLPWKDSLVVAQLNLSMPR